MISAFSFFNPGFVGSLAVGNTTPAAPTLAANDSADTLAASHALGTSEIVFSTNNGSYVAYTSTISVGDVARAAGYYKFKIKSAAGRNESAVVDSPAFTVAGSGADFTLPSTQMTSAAVYNTSTGVKIKDLWSGVTKTAGTHTPLWDGTDDDGATAPGGTYEARMVASDLTKTWEGVIGNTSTNFTGSTVHHAPNVMYGMLFSGSYGYYGSGYDEEHPCVYRFNISTPQIREDIAALSYDRLGGGQSTQYLCTDGTLIYLGGNLEPTTGFVWAIQVSNNAEYTFSSGSPLQAPSGHKLYASAIDNIDTTDNTSPVVTGLAVQVTGNYLFIAHKYLNQIKVHHKTTGAFVRTITYTSPLGMCIDGNDQIWIGNGTGVSKYTVNGDGTLTAAVLTLSGLVAPLAMAVSPDNSIIAICDGGSSQQVKAYSVSAGTSSWTLGDAGGFTNGAAVTNAKFMFKSSKFFTGPDSYDFSFIAFQSDGSFWVGDSGNLRAQHYNSSRTFIDRIQWQGFLYSTAIDANDPTRFFANFLEFDIDYSLPLSPSNGSWTFVRNWTEDFRAYYDELFSRFHCVTTFGNGRTYALHHNYIAPNHSWQIIELKSDGHIGFSGRTVPFADATIYPDGSLWTTSNPNAIGGTFTYYRAPLTGYDGSGYPTWGTAVSQASAPLINSSPVAIDGGKDKPILTTGGIIASFNPGILDIPTGRGSGWHLGGMKVGESVWNFLASKSTKSNYEGWFPSNGDFDIYNLVQYAGSYCRAIQEFIIWGYNGEFWKNGQVNKWTMFSEDGMLVDQWGTTRAESGHNANPEMAGNASGGDVCIDPLNGDIILIHSDESDHGGIHRWRISGQDSIIRQTVAIAATTIPAITGDLMVNLPINGNLVNGADGWTRSPTTNVTTTPYVDWWQVRTNAQTNNFARPDVQALFAHAGSSTVDYVNRDLGASGTYTTWNLKGKICFPDNDPSLGTDRGQLLILDAAGKIIATLYRFQQSWPTDIRVYGNTSIIQQTDTNSFYDVGKYLQPIEISAAAGVITFAYAGLTPVTASIFDGTGNWAQPRTMQMYFYAPSGRSFKMDIAEMVFTHT